jgi:uncharacterized membrane protein YfcA
MRYGQELQFTWPERVYLAFALLSAFLAGIGAYVVVELIPWHLGPLAALYGFFATGYLGAKAVEGIKDDRIRRYRETYNQKFNSDKNSN